MLDQQIDSASQKLVQFLQDLTANIQACVCQDTLPDHCMDLFQLRRDYAQQLGSLFDMLIHRLSDEYRLQRTAKLACNLDPVHIWRSIQTCIELLSGLQRKDLSTIIEHIHSVNDAVCRLLLHIKV